jgi:hypothetical protein
MTGANGLNPSPAVPRKVWRTVTVCPAELPPKTSITTIMAVRNGKEHEARNTRARTREPLSCGWHDCCFRNRGQTLPTERSVKHRPSLSLHLAMARIVPPELPRVKTQKCKKDVTQAFTTTEIWLTQGSMSQVAMKLTSKRSKLGL